MAHVPSSSSSDASYSFYRNLVVYDPKTGQSFTLPTGGGTGKEQYAANTETVRDFCVNLAAASSEDYDNANLEPGDSKVVDGAENLAALILERGWELRLEVRDARPKPTQATQRTGGRRF